MNPGAKKTQNDLINLHFAMPADEWIIQVVPESDEGRRFRDIVPWQKLYSARQVNWFRFANANGSHIYGRPKSTRYILIDDVKQEGITRLKLDGLNPTVVIETSPDNFQVWITASNDELPIPLATQLAKILERQYSTDTGSADALHLGRLPGLRNKKRKHETFPINGGPLVTLRTALTNPLIPECISELLDQARNRVEQESLIPSSSSSALGACAPNNSPVDIDSNRSPMTISEAIEIYEAELKTQVHRMNWNLPVSKGLRSDADFQITRGLFIKYGYDPDDLAALLIHASDKAAERGMDYVNRTVCAARKPYIRKRSA